MGMGLGSGSDCEQFVANNLVNKTMTNTFLIVVEWPKQHLGFHCNSRR